MGFLVIEMEGSRYSRNLLLVRDWDPEGCIVVQI